MFRSFKTSLAAAILLASSNPLLAGGHGSMGGAASHGSMGASLSHAAIRSAHSMGISRSLTLPQGPVNVRQLNSGLGGSSAGGGLSTRNLTLTNNSQSGILSAGSSNSPPPVVTPDHTQPVRTAPRVVTPVHTAPVNTSPPTTTPVHATPPVTTPVHKTPFPAPGNGSDAGGGINIIAPPSGGHDPGGPQFGGSAPPHLVNPPGAGSPPHLINPPGPGYQPPHGGQLVVGIGIGGGISFPGETVGYTETVVTTSSPATESTTASADVGEVKNAAAPSLDIELVDIRLVDAGSVEHGVGPRFRLFCRNNGTLEAPKFHITVMADLGSVLTEQAHQVTVESVGIKPGKTQTVDVQMPPEILKMKGNQDHWPRPFDLLVAMVDSDESLTETNKNNNSLVLTRDSIKPLVTE